MSENDVSTVSDGRPGFARRVAAGAIDSAAIAVPTIVVAWLAAERFPFASRDGGRPRFSQADQQRINEIDQSFNRAYEAGDAVYVLSGSGWWITVAALLILTVTVLFLLPARLQGRTLGKRLVGFGPTLAPGASTTEPELIESAARVATPARAAATYREGDRDGAAPTPDDLAGVDWIGGTDPGPSTGAESEPVDQAGQPSGEAETLANGDAPDDPPAGDGVGGEPVVTTLADAGDYEAWDRQEAMLGSSEAADGAVAATGYDALALPESSLAESPLATTSVGTVPEPSAATVPATDPIWSDDLGAWVFNDPDSGRLFRHDTDTGKWVPVQPA